jgi:hypothetical protein
MKLYCSLALAGHNKGDAAARSGVKCNRYACPSPCSTSRRRCSATEMRQGSRQELNNDKRQ